MSKRSSPIAKAVHVLRRLSEIRRARRLGVKKKRPGPKKDPTLFAYCDQFLE